MFFTRGRLCLNYFFLPMVNEHYDSKLHLQWPLPRLFTRNTERLAREIMGVGGNGKIAS